MDLTVVTTYVICDEVLNAMGYVDDQQALMSTAEVLTFSIVSGQLFGGNHARTRWFCEMQGYFPCLLSKSRLNRRLHSIPWGVWMAVFRFLALVFQRSSRSHEFAVDSFPVAACKKQRIDRRKFFLGKEHIGWAPAEHRYFCGIKVHMVVTVERGPVEVHFEPAATSDVTVLWKMELDLPAQSVLYADGAYNCYELEDILAEDSSIMLMARRKQANSKRARSQEQEARISSRRQVVETVFSGITQLLPRYIRASTERGFLLRVMSTILAYSVSLIS